MSVEYEMEELIPVVAKLAEQYTGFESTSITYEKAEQLMEAVLYCIRETGIQMSDVPAVSAKHLPAQEAYERGMERVTEKVRAALQLYNETLPEFCWYDNRCLYDTWIGGLPEFFRWYDVKFNPQDTILTLDYPVLKDLSQYQGIDRIYEYIRCIRMEQRFLHLFPEDSVRQILRRYHPGYRDMIDNLCEIVYQAAAVSMLTGAPLFQEDASENASALLRDLFLEADDSVVVRRLRDRTGDLTERYCSGDGAFLDYLDPAIKNAVVRLRIKAERSL